MSPGEAVRETYREQGRLQEQVRLLTIINKFHASKTHYLGARCWVCDLITELEGENK